MNTSAFTINVSNSRTAALLPLKDFVSAKQRLSGVLAPHERRALFHAMVEDVLSALMNARLVHHVLIVSDDPAADLIAAKFGAACISERQLGVAGLNPVVTAAAQYLEQQGFQRILITHGDLPLIDAQSVDAMLASSTDGVCIAPDAQHDGSNVMICSPPDAIEFHYGSGSCELHRKAAQARGVLCEMFLSDRLALDIDFPADLFSLIKHPMLSAPATVSATGQFLQQSGIADRLRAMDEAANSTAIQNERASS